MSDLIAELQEKTAELVAQAKEPLVRRIAEMEAAAVQREEWFAFAVEQWKAEEEDWKRSSC